MNLLKRLFIVALSVASFTSCDLNELVATKPTKQQMQGTWVLTKATDSQGTDITQKLSFPVTAIQLTDDNGMVGTMAPMFTYLVYGGSKWSEAAGKMDQLFDYVNMRFNTGEFFVADGQVDNFTVEAKLQATAIAGGGALTDILKIFWGKHQLPSAGDLPQVYECCRFLRRKGHHDLGVRSANGRRIQLQELGWRNGALDGMVYRQLPKVPLRICAQNA